jgi:hypothetical protein
MGIGGAVLASTAPSAVETAFAANGGGDHDWDPLANMAGAPNSCTSAAFNLLGRWDEATPVFARNFGFGSGTGPILGTDTISTVKVEIYSFAQTGGRIITNGLWLLRPATPFPEWSADKGCDANAGCGTWSSCGVYSSFEGTVEEWGLSDLTADNVTSSELGIFLLVENIYDKSGGQDIPCSIDSIQVTVTRAAGSPVVRYPAPNYISHVY